MHSYCPSCASTPAVTSGARPPAASPVARQDGAKCVCAEGPERIVHRLQAGPERPPQRGKLGHLLVAQSVLLGGLDGQHDAIERRLPPEPGDQVLHHGASQRIRLFHRVAQVDAQEALHPEPLAGVKADGDRVEPLPLVAARQVGVERLIQRASGPEGRVKGHRVDADAAQLAEQLVPPLLLGQVIHAAAVAHTIGLVPGVKVDGQAVAVVVEILRPGQAAQPEQNQPEGSSQHQRTSTTVASDAARST